MQAIHITLHGKNNVTYSGTLILQDNNWTSVDQGNLATPKTGASTSDSEDYDQVGASYYVIAVVLVYGMSIVMLIASHIKRRHEKVLEDKQIDKYLQDFQIVKERHDRDTYKNLKKTIMAKINWDRHHKDTYKNLQQTIIPVLAIGIPGTGHRRVSQSASTSMESLTSQRPARVKQLSAESHEEETNQQAENAARQLFDRPRRFSETSDILRRQILGLSQEEEAEPPNGRYLHPGSHRPSEASLTSVHSSSRRQIFTVEESCEDEMIDEDTQKARDKYEAEQAARQLFDRPRRASVCVDNSSMRNARMLRRSSHVQSIDEISLDRDPHSRRESFRDSSYRSLARESIDRRSFDIPPIEELIPSKFDRRASSPNRKNSTITPPITSSRSLTTSPVSWTQSQGQTGQSQGHTDTSPSTSQEKSSSVDQSASAKEEASQKPAPDQSGSCEYCKVGTGPHCGDVVWLDNNTSPDSGVATPTRDYLSPPTTIAPAITITRVSGSSARAGSSVLPSLGRHQHTASGSGKASPQPGVHRKPSSLTYAKPPSPFFQRSRSAPQGPNGATTSLREPCVHQHSAPSEPSPRTTPRTSPRTSPATSPKTSCKNSPRTSPKSTPRTSPRSSPSTSPSPFQRQAAVLQDPDADNCVLNMDHDSDSEEKVLQITVL